MGTLETLSGVALEPTYQAPESSAEARDDANEEMAAPVISNAHRAKMLEQLRYHDDEASHIRETLGISSSGEEIFQWECGDIDEDLIVVADGYGGASLQHVEGDGDNRFVHESRDFGTEEEACEIADLIMEGELALEDGFDETVTGAAIRRAQERRRANLERNTSQQ